MFRAASDEGLVAGIVDESVASSVPVVELVIVVGAIVDGNFGT